MSKDPASANVEVTPPKPPFRPNLSQSMSTGNDAERILSSIKPSDATFSSRNSRSKKGPSKFAMLMLATAVAAGAGYWYFVTQTHTSQPRSFDMAKADAGVTTAKADAATADKSSTTAPGTASLPSVPFAPATEQAAQIVNEPKAPVSSGANAQAQLTDALEKDVKPPEAAIQKALEGKPKSSSPAVVAAAPKSKAVTTLVKPDSKAIAKTTPKPDAKSSSTVVAKGTPSGSSSGAKTGAIPASKTASTSTVKTAPPAGDKDANLIAALLAHNAAAQTSPASTRPAAVKVASTDTANAQVKTTETSPAPSAKKPAVIARADSTESVLKKCESLDFLQREICRLKACDKLWETDSSCKATLTSAR